MEFLDPVPDGREVRRGVPVPAVGLADDERQRLAVPARKPGGESAQRPFADAGQAPFLQFLAQLC